MPAPLPPVTLTGDHVRLEPLGIDHATDLAAAAAVDRSSYDLTWVPDGIAATEQYIDGLLAARDRAEVLPFAQVDRASGRAVGCTRYLDPHWWRGRDLPDEIEIGGTWLGAAAQRTAINTEAKLLLLSHAFDELGVWRVAICTDERNLRSRTAIERLGANFDGLLPNHRLRADTDTPTPRTTAVYSITPEQWPDIRQRLRDRLSAT
jgi:RimJ/RimL family protein N-acetyltransferase